MGKSTRLEMYQQLLRTMPVAVWSKEVGSGGFLFTGGAIEEISGHPPEAFQQDPTLAERIIHPDDRARVREDFDRGIASAQPFEVEYRILHHQGGRVVWLHCHVAPVRNERGEVLRHTGVAADITTHKQIEERLAAKRLLVEAVASAAQCLLKASGWRECIGEVLAGMGRAARADRAYLIERTIGDELRTAACWRKDESPAGAAGGVTRHPADAAPCARWNSLLSRGEIVRGSLTDFPADEAAALRDRGVRSVLQIPIHVDDQWWGLIGFDDCGAGRDWSKGEIDALRALGGLVGGAIKRNRAERALQESKQRLESRVAERTAELIKLNQYLQQEVDGRRRTELALRRQSKTIEENEKRYRLLAETAQDSIYIIDRDDRIRYVNSYAARQLGCGPDQAVGRPRSDFFPSPANDHQEASLKLAFQDNRLVEREQSHDLPDGRRCWLHTRLVPLADETGRVTAVLGISRDMTERRRAAEALEESEQKYRTLVENLNVGVNRFAYLPEPRCLHANLACARIYGYDSVEEYMATPLDALYVDPRDRVKFLALLKKRGSLRDYRLRMRRNDGSEVTISSTVTAHFDDQGRLDYVDGIVEDITERLQIELQRERLSQAVENAGEGIGILDEDRRITYANTALARILGCRRPADILGTPWEDYMDPSTLPRWAQVKEALRKKGRWTGRLRGQRRKGNMVSLAVTLARIARKQGRGLVIVNVRDCTVEEASLAKVRELTIEAARSLENERARLSRELHDELGQILTAINLTLGWVSSRSGSWDRPTRERLAEVQALVNQMLETVRSLSTSLRPPILDNQGLLDAVRSYAREFGRRAGVSWRVIARPAEMEIRDPLATTAFRIIQESLTNIARHSRATRCGIFLSLIDGRLEIRVRDNGVGAVPKRLEGIQSLGILGMKERAASLGGTLKVENKPGGGVCVTARLPWHRLEKRNEE